MKKYIFLTNIPTPYRTSFYNTLFQVGLNFEVYYMRNIEDDRNWSIPLNGFKHPFIIDRGFYKMVGRYHLHFNPKLIFKIIIAKNADVIVGGSWNDIDVLILVMLKRIGLLRSKFYFWSEANYLTIGSMNDNWLKRFLRKFVFDTPNSGQLSSGKMTELTFKKWGIQCDTFIPLPNTIEEEEFLISDIDIKKRWETEFPIFLLPVRLIEEVKGIINFFKSIGRDNILKGVFLIAGEGPDRRMIEDYITSNKVENNIKLVGYCDTKEIVRLYKSAHVLILPSYSDPSPLSLIEALRMKLPLLVSDRCGNHFEAVLAGRNGYTFDPADPIAVKSAYEKLLDHQLEWPQMGENSGSIYKEKFDRLSVINNFIKGIIGPHN